MIGPEVHGIDGVLYSGMGAMATAIGWLWGRLKKCEERWDNLDKSSRRRANKVRRKTTTRKARK